MRAHPEPIGYQIPTSGGLVERTRVPTILFAVAERDRAEYAVGAFPRLYAHNATDALRLLEAERPGTIVVDWDDASLGPAEICTSARTLTNVSILSTTARVEDVPAILKVGCHGVLLKPFTSILLATRLGRLVKETQMARGLRLLPAGWQIGTNRVSPEMSCPKCGATGPTGFDFSSHRRMWYACLSCNGTWLARLRA